MERWSHMLSASGSHKIKHLMSGNFHRPTAFQGVLQWLIFYPFCHLWVLPLLDGSGVYPSETGSGKIFSTACVCQCYPTDSPCAFLLLYKISKHSLPTVLCCFLGLSKQSTTTWLAQNSWHLLSLSSEARSSKSRCQQDPIPSETLAESFLASS